MTAFGRSIRRLNFHCHFRASTVIFLQNSSRCFSSKKEKARKPSGSSKKYADTLNLPSTTFPLSMKNIADVEVSLQEQCRFGDLYEWQRNDPSRTTDFILHDGPPYANGDIHVGHTLNKIVKDIACRYKLLRGFRVHYEPGWDCHGLPIELKAVRSEAAHDTMYIRRTAREFASAAANRQRDSFRRLGVMANWDDRCYFTNSPQYQATQLLAFCQLYEKGFVFQDYMPVYWSPSSRTAIAEAELEYNAQHVSEAIYLRFRMSVVPDCVKVNTVADEPVFALVWTTTPWTIPANKAICFSHNLSYTLGRELETGLLYILGTDRLPDLELETNMYFTQLTTFKGSELSSSTYIHPLSGATCPLLTSDHVTADKGTGLVHTAPAHGHDDYQVALKHGLAVDCSVDELGRFAEDAGHGLQGKSVLTDGNKAVVSLLGADVVHRCAFEHSYPYDWRTGEPVIIRASRQWFIDTARVRDRAMEVMKSVRVIPAAMTQAMTSLLGSRSRWCISRQRVWGVPIPVFYHPSTREPVVNKHVIDHVISLVREQGSDCWWSLSRDQLLPQHVMRKAGLDPSVEYEKGGDIFDIWLDSGISWKCVLPDPGVADVYAEGSDQFRGWFQSALLTSVALRDKAPYRTLLVHGFTVDEDGRKMSKSRGNVIDPHTLIDGGKLPVGRVAGYGADVLRWWAGRQYLHANLPLGPTVLDDAQKQVFNVRKTLRFLLGNLSDYSPEHEVTVNRLLPVDKYMLHLTQHFKNKILESYDDYDFASVLIQVEKFINTHVSSLYLAIIKDRIYCDLPEGQGRRSCQTVLRYLYDVITMATAPVLPHLAEEVNLHCQNQDETSSSFFHSVWSDVTDHHDVIDDVTRSGVEALVKMKDDVNNVIASENPVGYDVTVMADDQLYSQLQSLMPEAELGYCSVTEVLQCSSCRLIREGGCESGDFVHGTCQIHTQTGAADGRYALSLRPAAAHRCPRCRRHTTHDPRMPCTRCLHVMADSWS